MSEQLPHALPAGCRLDEYEVESVLGHGGFGVTYLARDIRLGTKVAIKEFMPSDMAVRMDGLTVRPKSETDRDGFLWGLDRFLKEAQTLARFKHPNIVPVLRYFEANGTAYTVMEYQEGEGLDRLLAGKKRLVEAELWPILVPLLDGLAEVHKAGFLHRDIKPANIYVRTDGSPVLLDFGAARQALGQRSQSLTAIVTAGYAPYEQYGSSGRQGPWTDIYALGAVLYRAITGQTPPQAPDRAARLLSDDQDPLTPASVAGKGQCRAEILAAIDKALSVRENDRPQSVQEWRDLLSAERTRAGPADAGKGWRTGGLAAGLVLTLVLAGGGYAIWAIQPIDGDTANAPRADNATPLETARAPTTKTAAEGPKPGDAGISGAAIGPPKKDAKRKAEEESRRQVEEENKRRAEEARKKAEEEAARQKAAEEARRKAEEDAARRRAEEESKRRAEEARKKTEEDAARRKAAEEARRKAEEDAARRRAEEESQRRAEEARKKTEEDAARRKAAEAARRQAEEETARKKAAEAARKAAKEEEAKKAAAAEARRKAEAKRQEELERRLAELERRARAAEKQAQSAQRAASGTAGGTQLAKADPTTSDGLKTLFTGSSMQFQRAGLGPYGEDYVMVKTAADGRMSANWQNDQGGHSGSQNGKWWVEDGKLCLQWSIWDDGESRCYIITGSGGNYKAAGAQGLLTGSFVLSK